MPNNNDDDLFSGLIAAGTLLLVGYGIYKIIRPIFSFKEGQTVNTLQLKTAAKQINDETSMTKIGSMSYSDFYDKSGKKVGSVSYSDLYNAKGNKIGYTSYSDIYSVTGKKLGHVSYADVFDISGRNIGHMSYSDVYSDGSLDLSTTSGLTLAIGLAKIYYYDDDD